MRQQNVAHSLAPAIPHLGDVAGLLVNEAAIKRIGCLVLRQYFALTLIAARSWAVLCISTYSIVLLVRQGNSRHEDLQQRPKAFVQYPAFRL